MLHLIKDLEKCTIGATDGEIGHVEDFYFDDEAWVIRYLVVRAGAWLGGRNVLVSPYSVGASDWKSTILPVSITKEQVRNSPLIDTERPVSRQHEMSYLGYYGYPYYWGGLGIWGASFYPGMAAGFGYEAVGLNYRNGRTYGVREAPADAEERRENEDPHLRSCNEIAGYHLLATDGDLGHVQGFLVDDKSWSIRYLIVNTSNWWLGHQFLIAPEWIDKVSWAERSVTVNLNRQTVKDSPPYDESIPLDSATEALIYRHYGRPVYWQDDSRREVA